MKKALLALIVILAISTPALADIEFLTNGNFEQGTASTPPSNVAPAGWTYYTAISNTGNDGTNMGSNYLTAGGNISEGKSGTTGYTMNTIDPDGKCFYMSTRGGNTSGGCNGIYQTVTVDTAGTFTLTGTIAVLNYGISAGSADWYAWEVGLIAGEWNSVPPFYGSSGQRVPEIGNTSDTFGIWGAKNGTANGSEITLNGTNVMAGRNNVMHLVAGTYTVYIQAATNCAPDAANKQRLKLMADNMSLTGVADPAAVPEPGTLLAAFSVLAPVGVVFRRKK